MKKRLILVPLMAGVMLTGCEFTLFGKTIRLFEKDPGEAVLNLPENFKMEYEGYKMVTSLKEGEYLLGVYRINEETMRFANGGYHTDNKGDYSFYMSTTTEIDEAATIKVKSVGNGEYTLQYNCPGKYWHNKYIGVYNSQTGEDVGANYVMSIAALDTPDSTSFEVRNRHDVTVLTDQTVQSHFRYFETYEDSPAYTIAAMFQHVEKLDPEPVPKFLGTGHNTNGGADFTSIDTKSYDVALSLESYDLAHLYEKI